MNPRSGLDNRFLNQLSEPDLELLQNNLEHVALRPGDCLYRTGDAVGTIVFPHGGLVALAIPDGPARSADAAVIGLEGIVGGFATLSQNPVSHSAVVRIAGTASAVSAAVFRDALDASTTMRRLAARFEAVTMAQILQTAMCNAAHPVEARICRWLLDIHDRTGCDRIPLPQKSLAQTLGVRRTTVTLAAGKLQSAGAIRCRRGNVHVIDRALLERHACACYERMREFTDRVLAAPGRSTPPLQPDIHQDGNGHRNPSTADEGGADADSGPSSMSDTGGRVHR